MSIEQEIAGLTQSTTDLLEAVNTKKATLDTAVSNAQTAVVDATSQVSLAAAEKVGAQSARDEAETHKDLAYTYSQSAASAVAYQDLTAIAESKAETAVDVFVYDTRKDSDGGAWRERTQGTSWYNETLNTTTRGSRKEFPAVAVIVAESNKVTIYDGDDPSLPMWMVFNKISSSNSWEDAQAMLASTSYPITSINAINGTISLTSKRTVGYVNSFVFGLFTINFISDDGYVKGAPTAKKWIAGIEQRNVLHYRESSSGTIVNGQANDVAMTVLPDAPIDPATGLPIPTIAVATDGGVSVIKDDGTVVDITYAQTSQGVNFISFVDEGVAFLSRPYNTVNNFHAFHYLTLPTSDTSEAPDAVYSYSNDGNNIQLTSSLGGYTTPLKNVLGTSDETFVIGSNSYQGNTGNGIYVVNYTKTLGQQLVNHITSTYNTGWMNGDIKLATLSDTDDTDLVGSELVTNGTFDTDTSGWTDTSVNGGSVAYSAGTAALTSVADNTGGRMEQTIATVIGRRYRLTVDRLSGSSIIQAPGYQSFNETGTIVTEFVATSTSSKITALKYNSGTAYIDNVSVRLVEEDRSVNNNSLQVFGTVARTPVETGADLVGYSGFSGSNFLMQPYNSDLDFGTGDFCIMGWVKDTPSTAAIDYVLYRRQANSVGAQLAFQINSSHLINFIATGGATITSQSPVRTGGWVHVCAIRDGGVVRLYINSALEASGSNTQSLSNEGAYLVLGAVSTDGVAAGGALNTGSLALWRISGTAPTAEQIAKIYRDEKVLFQEGAQATLYGTSDAVTALAYDTDTELLHVGTSAGRSVFKGLQRVDNTTDAVGTAISASNNLVVEE